MVLIGTKTVMQAGEDKVSERCLFLDFTEPVDWMAAGVTSLAAGLYVRLASSSFS